MTIHSDHDPDDNFARAFDAQADIDEEAALELLVWQWLLLINPGDEDAALQQFDTCREQLADTDDLASLLREATDWKSSFHIEDGDAEGLVQALDELAARFNLRIDWDIDDDAVAEADVPALINTAFERLREHHYTVWTHETGGDGYAGWLTLQRDDEAMRQVAGALGLHVRTGAG